jgi:hypothetical protein
MFGGAHRHAGLVEVRLHGRGAGGAEDRERGLLGRDDADLHVVLSHAVRVPRRHQRELVGRQRPGRTRRDHERDALRVTLLEVAAQPAEHLRVAFGRPGDSPAEDRLAAGSRGDHKRVVAQFVALIARGGAASVVHSGQGTGHELGADVLGDLGCADALTVAAPKRLRRRHRPEDELI